MGNSKSGDPVESFLQLSRALTGEANLPRDLAEQYSQRIHDAFAEQLIRLLAKFSELSENGNGSLEQIGPAIMQDDDLGGVAKEIIMLWYISGFRVPDANDPTKFKELGPETPEQYFRGLFWPTIHAHPQGLSGGYFGYWKYRPEN